MMKISEISVFFISLVMCDLLIKPAQDPLGHLRLLSVYFGSPPDTIFCSMPSQTTTDQINQKISFNL
jgi:hypothetical protein